MVEKLCSRYGTPIRMMESASEDAATPSPSKGIPSTEGPLFYAFPTLDQLAKATEADLRAAGFG